LDRGDVLSAAQHNRHAGKLPHLVMPEGRKIRKRSDYIFRLSGISCRLVTVVGQRMRV